MFKRDKGKGGDQTVPIKSDAYLSRPEPAWELAGGRDINGLRIHARFALAAAAGQDMEWDDGSI
jgi:hypothetical protein